MSDRRSVAIAELQRTERVRAITLTLTKWIFAAAVVAFGAWYITQRWTQVSAAIRSMNAIVLVGALLCVALALGFSMFSWRALWPAFDAAIGVRAGARLFYVSQLGKYVPGSVWPIAAQAQMAKALGLSRTSSVILSLLALLISVAVGLAVGSVLAPFIDPQLLARFWWLLLVGAALVACLIPRVLVRVVRIALRLLRRPDAPFRFTPSISIRTAAPQLVNWLLGGLQLWLLLVGLGADPATSLVPCLAAFPLAFCLGILLIPFPAGLGVREFVIVLLLASIVPAPIAVTAAVISRLIYALCDFAFAGASVLIAARSNVSRSGSAISKL